ncbi:hypothetical protein [Alteribacter natronophilus]|uniref:hypothetical protein n=1 Tax=Alteribacter natronophilus TaxID=2583810 RepID=UPI00110E409C|nr:hypothetical protein [Alteribacter natronophilus]TMW72802.1 hypothetical protein FGB90_00365 [Alteribacter natronophilus]
MNTQTHRHLPITRQTYRHAARRTNRRHRSPIQKARTSAPYESPYAHRMPAYLSIIGLTAVLAVMWFLVQGAIHP